MAVHEYYLWQVRSFTARVALDFVDKLNLALTDPRLKQGEEWGGILLGRIVSPQTVEITGFELIPSNHRRGTIYALGLRERQRVNRVVTGLSRGKSRPVGFFRTHLRPGLFLDQDDFALMTEIFADPSQLALLIRPAERGPLNAGMFFWEDGDIDRRQTAKPFPFNSETLRVQGPIEIPAPLPVRASGTRRRLPLPSLPTIAKPVLGWSIAAVATLAMVAAGLAEREKSAPAVKAPPVVRSVSALAIARLDQSVPGPEPVFNPQPENTPPVPTAKTRPGAVAPMATAPKAATPKFAASKAAALKTTALKTTALKNTASKTTATKPAAAPVEPVLVASSIAPSPAPLPPPVRTAVFAPAPRVVAPTKTDVLPVNRPASVAVSISVEPKQSEFKRVIHHFPLIGRSVHPEDGSDFSPPRPGRSLEPRIPPLVAEDLSGEVAVDVRLSIDRNGSVRKSEVVNSVRSDLASLAANSAAGISWEPAREGDRSIPSDVIVHYRFRPR